MIQEVSKRFLSCTREVNDMFGHPKNVVYDKGIKVFDSKDRDSRLLEKEELLIISIFTAIVLAALLIVYVL
jgi:hypothetical protein